MYYKLVVISTGLCRYVYNTYKPWKSHEKIDTKTIYFCLTIFVIVWSNRHYKHQNINAWKKFFQTQGMKPSTGTLNSLPEFVISLSESSFCNSYLSFSIKSYHKTKTSGSLLLNYCICILLSFIKNIIKLYIN